MVPSVTTTWRVNSRNPYKPPRFGHGENLHAQPLPRASDEVLRASVGWSVPLGAASMSGDTDLPAGPLPGWRGPCATPVGPRARDGAHPAASVPRAAGRQHVHPGRSVREGGSPSFLCVLGRRVLCVSVGLSVCMSLCVCVCVRLCVCMCEHLCVCVSVCDCMCICECVCVFVRVQRKHAGSGVHPAGLALSGHGGIFYSSFGVGSAPPGSLAGSVTVPSEPAAPEE